MKLLSFQYQGVASWGAIVGDHVADLGRAFPQYPTLQSYLAAGRLANLAHDTAWVKADVPLAEIEYLPVITQPEKIICAIRNYHDHHKEVVAAGLDRELSSHPPIFLRTWRSQVAHGQPILRPHCSDSLDWEGELAVVIGRSGRNIPEDQAHNHVAGYSIYNDASIREWQFHAKAIAAGKNFESTGAFGPWMVTADEIDPARPLELSTRLNGERMQSGSTKTMIFDCASIVSYVSQFMTLLPGDLIITGTPPGVGHGFKPPRYLKAGDVMSMGIEGLGVAHQQVVKYKAA